MWDIPIAPRVHFLAPSGEEYVARDVPDIFGNFKAFDSDFHTLTCHASMVVLSWRLCAHSFPTMHVDVCDHDLAATCDECGSPIWWNKLAKCWCDVQGNHIFNCFQERK